MNMIQKMRILKREYDKTWTIGGEIKYSNLSTLMYDFIESCWYLILRAHVIIIWDNTLHEKGGVRIVMLYTFVFL